MLNKIIIIMISIMLFGCEGGRIRVQTYESTTVITSNIHKIYFDVTQRECMKVSGTDLSYISYVEDTSSETEKNVQNTIIKFTCDDGSDWEYRFSYDLIP